MVRPPPRAKRPDTLFPYTTLFRSVELVEVFGVEVGADKGEVVIDAVAPGREIDPIEVADTLRVNQRRDRPPGYAEGPPLDIRPVRVQARVDRKSTRLNSSH